MVGQHILMAEDLLDIGLILGFALGPLWACQPLA